MHLVRCRFSSDPFNNPDLTVEIPATTRLEYPVTPPVASSSQENTPNYSPYPQHQAPAFSMLQNWTAWSDWSACSMPCGGGLKARKRLCMSEVCLGQSNETTECNMHPCPSMIRPGNDLIVNRTPLTTFRFQVTPKEWTEWSAWSACE